jgi:hypothetical protein
LITVACPLFFGLEIQCPACVALRRAQCDTG